MAVQDMQVPELFFFIKDVEFPVLPFIPLLILPFSLLKWHPLGESNPSFRDENPMS